MRTSSGQEVSREKLHAIQFLRAVAALLVVLFHAHQAFATRFGAVWFPNEEYYLGFGAVGVHIFFVISGFIMVYTTRFDGGYSPADFFRRRLVRIYPIYWICVGLYLLGYRVLDADLGLTGSDTLGALLLLPGDAAEIIGPAWTLAFEMFFYLCFGLAMILGLQTGLIALSATFLIAILCGVLVPFEHPALLLATSPLLLEFIAGAFIGWLLVAGRLPAKGAFSLITLAMLLFAGGIVYGYDSIPRVVIWGTPSVLLVAGLVMAERRRGASALIRRFGHFGDSSYALYLIHILVIAFAVASAVSIPALKDLPPLIVMVPIALVSLLIAEFLHHRVERPLLRRLRSRPPLLPVEFR